jgi:hypothetical protein
MNAHFFDINSLIKVNSKVWIVSKTKPNIPIIKISESDFNLIKKGIWKNSGVKIKIGNSDYYIKEDLFEQIKIKCKKTNTDLSSICFSMQEFMNSDIIKDLDYIVLKDHLINLKNTNDEIYVICSKNSKENYKYQIEKLEEYLLTLGLKVKKFYFITETFYNRNSDKVSHKKVRLLLQHIIGFKTDEEIFTDEKIEQYDEVFFYDDEPNSIKFCKMANDLLKFLYDNSEDTIKERVKNIVDTKNLVIHCKEVTFNKVNPYITSHIKISLDRILKTFESFRMKF